MNAVIIETIVSVLANLAVTLIGVAVFLIMLVEAAIRRRPGRANPWGEGATTLEWTLSSPPPFHQFSTPPVIKHDDHH